jgi:hypothetical protein
MSGTLVDERLAYLQARRKKIWRKYRCYRGFSLVAVCLGIVAPILAGAALTKGLPGLPSWWGPFVGILALLAAIATALHKGLHCEEYQVRCRAVLAKIDIMTIGYDALRFPDEVDQQFRAMDEKLTKFHQDESDVNE